LNCLCSAGIGAAEADEEPVAVPEVPEPLAPEPLAPEPLAPVLVPGDVVTFEAEDTADDTAGVAEVVVGVSDEVTLLTVETTVETTEVGGGGGGDDDVGSGTLVEVGSGTLVDVGSGTVVLVGSGTLVDVGSGTVVVGKVACALGETVPATPASRAQKAIDSGARRLICVYNPARR
jgi:hypothetical protein